MPESTARILCTGDLHLGRLPSRIPTQNDELTVETVWDSIVEYCIAQSIDALVLTGDIVDRSNRYFEAYGPLKRGLMRLATADIPTFAVAGNHDFDVLPRLADSLGNDAFRLLGRGGRWELASLSRGGRELIRFAGWSFPEQAVRDSPVEEFELNLPDEIPTFGVLHCDVDQQESRYAPVALRSLFETGIRNWLLGHIHRPGVMEGPTGKALYPGSPQALSPKESGAHGPWLVQVDTARNVTMRQISLATVRYRSLEVDMTGIDKASDFEANISQLLQDDLEALVEEYPSVRHVVYRPKYTGMTELHADLEHLNRPLVQDLELPYERAIATVDSVEVATRPSLDLEQLSRGNDPPAVLARFIRSSGDGAATDGDSAKLVEATLAELERVYQATPFDPLRGDSATNDKPDVEDARAHLVRQAVRLLEKLLDQQIREGSYE